MSQELQQSLTGTLLLLSLLLPLGSVWHCCRWPSPSQCVYFQSLSEPYVGYLLFMRLFSAIAKQMFVLSHTPDTWALVQSLLQMCVGSCWGSPAPVYFAMGCWQSCSSCPRAGASSRVFPISWAALHSPCSIMVLHPQTGLCTGLIPSGLSLPLPPVLVSTCPCPAPVPAHPPFLSVRPWEGDGHQTDFACLSPCLDHVRVAVEKAAEE